MRTRASPVTTLPRRPSSGSGGRPPPLIVFTLSARGTLCCSVQRDSCGLATVLLMLDWLWKRGSPAPDRSKTFGDIGTRPSCAMSGPYLLLYTYLDKRYADTLVLTFTQIEDILGFALPDAARLHREWWAHSAIDAGGSSYSDAWILAKRTAVPNLPARTVMFARAY